jgi:L-glutamine-phosphate cytidylyltransferase
MSEKTSAPRVTTAVLLAAGSGRRLLPLTQTVPKCLVDVAGRTVLDRFVSALQEAGWRRLVIVAGYLGHHIDAFVRQWCGSLAIETVYCPDYETTNNIVSLHAVRNRVDGPVLIAEADLVLDPGLLAPLARPNRLAIDHFDAATMHGTTVSLDAAHRVCAMQVGAGVKPAGPLFKTVNLTSLSSQAWRALGERVDARVRAGDVASFYEAALADLLAAREIRLHGVQFAGRRWAEVDNVEDLAIAEGMFAAPHPSRPRVELRVTSEASR